MYETLVIGSALFLSAYVMYNALNMNYDIPLVVNYNPVRRTTSNYSKLSKKDWRAQGFAKVRKVNEHLGWADVNGEDIKVHFGTFVNEMSKLGIPIQVI